MLSALPRPTVTPRSLVRSPLRSLRTWMVREVLNSSSRMDSLKLPSTSRPTSSDSMKLSALPTTTPSTSFPRSTSSTLSTWKTNSVTRRLKMSSSRPTSLRRPSTCTSTSRIGIQPCPWLASTIPSQLTRSSSTRPSSTSREEILLRLSPPSSRLRSLKRQLTCTVRPACTVKLSELLRSTDLISFPSLVISLLLQSRTRPPNRSLIPPRSGRKAAISTRPLTATSRSLRTCSHLTTLCRCGLTVSILPWTTLRTVSLMLCPSSPVA
mmetsp:Transcript_37056/g.56828  ORF Transcript_37056/g.56828 Transcript_37056/m.56828 type:complete len:267 (+) Transcript_37056:3175-3975(+)